MTGRTSGRIGDSPIREFARSLGGLERAAEEARTSARAFSETRTTSQREARGQSFSALAEQVLGPGRSPTGRIMGMDVVVNPHIPDRTALVVAGRQGGKDTVVIRSLDVAPDEAEVSWPEVLDIDHYELRRLTEQVNDTPLHPGSFKTLEVAAEQPELPRADRKAWESTYGPPRRGRPSPKRGR